LKHFVENILLITTMAFTSYAQDKSPGSSDIFTAKEELRRESSSSIITVQPDKKESVPVTPIQLYRYELKMFQPASSEIRSSFDPVSAFRTNIRFGGFWDRYAIINFTPALNISPFDFINFSAYHNISYFVPVKAANEHFRSMTIQSAAVLCVETAFRFINILPPMISDVTVFLLKNAIIKFMQRSVLNEGSDKIFRQVNYYYNLRIRF
jgi:hypothetical protein